MDMILKRRKLTLLLPGMFTIIVLPLTPAAGLEKKSRKIYMWIYRKQIQNLDKAANGVTLSDPESIAVTCKNIENYFV